MSELATLSRAEQELAALGPLPFPLPLGRLAPVVAGAVSAMAKGDWIVAGPRERVGAVLRGCPVQRLLDPAAGARPYKVAPVTGSPGARALHAVGLALGSERPVLCFLGMASAAAGPTHEALNTAVLTGAPVVFVHSHQALPDDAPVARQLAGDLAAIAAAHGLAVDRLDLATAEDQVQAVRDAVTRARQAAAAGPQLLAITLS